MRTLLILALAVFTSLSSCKEEDKSSETTQMQEVIAIHDEVMPKMSKISNLVSQLKPMADTASSDTTYQKAIGDLQAAHKSMMDWMQGFGERFDSEEILKGKPLSSEKQQWLDEEEIKVKAMRAQVNQSIRDAEKLLDQQ